MHDPSVYAYTAGIVDGEGSIGLQPFKNGYRYPSVSVSSTTPSIVYWLKN